MTTEPSSPVSRLSVIAGPRADRATDLPWRVLLWMFAGLLVSGVTSWLIASSPDVGRMAVELALPLIVGQVVFVIAINAAVPAIGAGAVLALFVVYSGTMGLTLACLFIAADRGSVSIAFLSAAGMFGVAGVYGAATGWSLSNLRGCLAMLLIGFVIVWLLNVAVFTRPADELRASILSVVAFVGLTAWSLRGISRADDRRATGSTVNGSVVTALVLYLEVVNIFLYLVRQVDRIVGDTREDPAWHARHGLPTDRRTRPR